jgi:hypothetical protein
MVDYQSFSTVLTGIGLIVALVYYGLQIRNQNRTRQAQLFMQFYNRYQDYFQVAGISKDIISDRLSGLGEYQERYNSDERFKLAMDSYLPFYEGLGVMVKEGFFSIRLVALMWAGMTRMFYENVIEPTIEDMREYSNYPRLWSEAEWLGKELIMYLEEHPELRT